MDAVTPRRSAPLLVLALLVVAANLRTAIASVGPVLGEMTSELGLNGTEAGLLTTLPVICFAAVSPLAAWAAGRFGLDRTLVAALVLAAVAIAVRPAAGTVLLLVASAAIGAAITVGNVLVPVAIKRDLPDQVSRYTSYYTAALIAGAALAAGLTAPLSAVSSWHWGLAVWAVPSLLAAILWPLGQRAHARAGDAVPVGAVGAALAGRPAAATRAGIADPAATDGDDVRAPAPERRTSVWRHPTAWAVAILLGAQSSTYFALTAWLVDLLNAESGLSVPTAGLVLAVYQLLGIAGSLAVPPLAARAADQRTLSIAIGVLWVVPFVGLALLPGWWPAWALAAGLAQGAGLALALALIGLRSADAATARSLSGMSQTVGYCIGAAGPVLMGALFEVTGGWDAALLAMVPVALLMSMAGLWAGRDVVIR